MSINLLGGSVSHYDSAEDKERERRWKKLGIKYATVARYNELFRQQKGKCAICGAQEKTPGKFTLNLDHDHKTGLIRGLLCWKCNKKLDHFLISNRLLKAFNYIRKHKLAAKNDVWK